MSWKVTPTYRIYSSLSSSSSSDTKGATLYKHSDGTTIHKNTVYVAADLKGEHQSRFGCIYTDEGDTFLESVLSKIHDANHEDMFHVPDDQLGFWLGSGIRAHRTTAAVDWSDYKTEEASTHMVVPFHIKDLTTVLLMNDADVQRFARLSFACFVRSAQHADNKKWWIDTFEPFTHDIDKLIDMLNLLYDENTFPAKEIIKEDVQHFLFETGVLDVDDLLHTMFTIQRPSLIKANPAYAICLTQPVNFLSFMNQKTTMITFDDSKVSHPEKYIGMCDSSLPNNCVVWDYSMFEPCYSSEIVRLRKIHENHRSTTTTTINSKLYFPYYRLYHK